MFNACTVCYTKYISSRHVWVYAGHRLQQHLYGFFKSSLSTQKGTKEVCLLHSYTKLNRKALSLDYVEANGQKPRFPHLHGQSPSGKSKYLAYNCQCGWAPSCKQTNLSLYFSNWGIVIHLTCPDKLLQLLRLPEKRVTGIISWD